MMKNKPIRMDLATKLWAIASQIEPESLFESGVWDDVWRDLDELGMEGVRDIAKELQWGHGFPLDFEE